MIDIVKSFPAIGIANEDYAYTRIERETSSARKLTPREFPAISGPHGIQPGCRCLLSNLIRIRAPAFGSPTHLAQLGEL